MQKYRRKPEHCVAVQVTDKTNLPKGVQSDETGAMFFSTPAGNIKTLRLGDWVLYVESKMHVVSDEAFREKWEAV